MDLWMAVFAALFMIPLVLGTAAVVHEKEDVLGYCASVLISGLMTSQLVIGLFLAAQWSSG